MNNFDTSTQGVNLDLSCFYDVSLSQDTFNECFKRVGNNDRIWQFVDYGNHTEIDISDHESYSFTKGDLKNAIFDYSGLSDEYLKTEAFEYFGKYYSVLSKDQLLELLDTKIYTETDRVELFQKHFTPKFEIIKIHGYSQGDYAEVIFSHDAMKDYVFKDQETMLVTMRKHFTNLFFDAPIFCRLSIDDDEIDFSEYLEDGYDYDKQTILLQADQIVTHNKKIYIMEWLNENLPSSPDYH